MRQAAGPLIENLPIVLTGDQKRSHCRLKPLPPKIKASSLFAFFALAYVGAMKGLGQRG